MSGSGSAPISVNQSPVAVTGISLVGDRILIPRQGGGVRPVLYLIRKGVRISASRRSSSSRSCWSVKPANRLVFATYCIYAFWYTCCYCGRKNPTERSPSKVRVTLTQTNMKCSVNS
ncbi:MAG: hypothetical protein HC862_25915 [Scytonema sp. RU_4_4]|nr:hypothetical protein [Scytonema sp. RU_4_4]